MQGLNLGTFNYPLFSKQLFNYNNIWSCFIIVQIGKYIKNPTFFYNLKHPKTTFKNLSNSQATLRYG